MTGSASRETASVATAVTAKRPARPDGQALLSPRDGDGFVDHRGSALVVSLRDGDSTTAEGSRTWASVHLSWTTSTGSAAELGVGVGGADLGVGVGVLVGVGVGVGAGVDVGVAGGWGFPGLSLAADAKSVVTL